MIWLALAIVLIILCFGAVLLRGAPYLPTLSPQVRAAFELLELQPGDCLIELGCGDGKVLLAAAGQGIRAVGYELNPLLWALAWLRTRRQRKYIRVIWGDFWRKPWPPAQAIFTFLLPKYMAQLDKKIVQYKHKPVKLVSFAFSVPGREPILEKSGVYLYQYE